MRQGIFKQQDGVRRFDMLKIIGKSFGNFWFTNTRNIRYRLLKGSRNCKKSYNCSYEAVFKILSDPQKNVLFVRAQDVDNRDSTYASVCKAIYDLGLEDSFTMAVSPLRIVYKPTKQTILFRGMSNPTSLNSLTFATGFLTDVYIEEAYEIDSYDAFVKLDQSVRAGKGYDENGNLVNLDIPQQITMMFNAWSDQTWLYTEFFKNRLEDDPEYLETHKYMDYKDENFVGPGGTGIYLAIMSYKCNEFRNQDQVDVSAKEMKEKNIDYYRTLFLGCWGSATSMTYPEFSKANIISEDKIRDDYIFVDFAIGIDTGLSTGEGKKISVKKNEDVAVRVRAATTMILGGITPNYEKFIAIDEYFHSNDVAYNSTNTDNRDDLNIDQQASALMNKIIEWINKYGNGRNKRGDILMKGRVNVFIDSADTGFRDVMEMKAREFGVFNVGFYPSTKKPIQGRVDFERIMLSYQSLLISEKCPNLIREFKNSRRGKKGEARENLDDHCLNGLEYSNAPFRDQFVLWKTNFKEH